MHTTYVHAYLYAIDYRYSIIYYCYTIVLYTIVIVYTCMCAYQLLKHYKWVARLVMVEGLKPTLVGQHKTLRGLGYRSWWLTQASHARGGRDGCGALVSQCKQPHCCTALAC